MVLRSKRLLASKVVVVGDARCGKTSLIRALDRAHKRSTQKNKDKEAEVVTDEGNDSASPSYIDENILLKQVKYTYGGQERVLPELLLVDTVAVLNEAGTGEGTESSNGENELRGQRERLRPSAYVDTKVIVVCFSLGDRASFENVVEKWIPEVTHFCGPSVKLVLVGCKCDLNEEDRAVKTDETRECAVKVGAKRYIECSASTGEGVDLLLDMLAMGLGTWGKGHSHPRVCVVL